jgi:phage tail sheath gpL-like
MLGDTITLVHNAGSKVLVKVNQDNYSAEYLLRESLTMFKAKVYHSTVKSNGHRRHGIELRETTFAAGEVPEFERLTYLITQSKESDANYDLTDSLADFLLVSSNANLIKIIGDQS